MLRTSILGSATALTFLLGFYGSVGAAIAAPAASSMPGSAAPSSVPPSDAAVQPADPADSLPPGYTVSIDAPVATRVGQTFVLRANTSVTPAIGTYRWEFGDGVTAEGHEVTHLYGASGTFEVTLRHEPLGEAGRDRLIAHQTVTAFRQSTILFTTSLGEEAERTYRSQALEHGTSLEILTVVGHTTMLQQESLEQLLASHREDIELADLLVSTLDEDVTLSALVGVAQSGAGKSEEGKTLLLLVNHVPESSPRLARLVVEMVQPARIIFAERSALNTVVRTDDPANVDVALRSENTPSLVADAQTPGPPRFALLSQLVDELLRRGTRAQSILLILLVPLIVAVIVFLRQVVGLSTMGLFVPVVMALSYVLMGTLTGLLASVGIIIAGIFVRWMLKKVRLLYLGRVGLATSIVVFLLLLMMLAIALVAPQLLPDLAIFPLLVLALITERTYSVIAERGIKSALLIFMETTVVALLAAVVAGEWAWLRTLLFAWPELVLLFLLMQLIIGRYTGLRATELFRFRELLNEVEYAEEE